MCFSNISSRRLLGAAFLTLLVGCDQSNKQVEKTRSQLHKVAKDVGVEVAFETLGKGYDSSVAPVVAAGLETVDRSETLRSVRDTGAEYLDVAAQAGGHVVAKAERVVGKIPRSEKEAQQLVNGYTISFTEWIRSAFPNFGREFNTGARFSNRSGSGSGGTRTRAEVLNSLNNQLGGSPRGRPHTPRR